MILAELKSGIMILADLNSLLHSSQVIISICEVQDLAQRGAKPEANLPLLSPDLAPHSLLKQPT